MSAALELGVPRSPFEEVLERPYQPLEDVLENLRMDVGEGTVFRLEARKAARLFFKRKPMPRLFVAVLPLSERLVLEVAAKR